MIRKLNKLIAYMLTMSMLTGVWSVPVMAADTNDAGDTSVETVVEEQEEVSAGVTSEMSVEEDDMDEESTPVEETAEDEKNNDQAVNDQDQVEDSEGQDQVEDSEDQDQVEDKEDQDQVEDSEGQDQVEDSEDQDQVEDNEDQDQVEAGEGQDQVEVKEDQDQVEDDEDQDQVEDNEDQDQVEVGEDQDQVEVKEDQDQVEGNKGRDQVEDSEEQNQVESNEGRNQVEENEGQNQGEGNEVQDDTKIDLSDAEIYLDKVSFIYDGNVPHPEVTVSYDGFTLEEDVEYEVVYDDSAELGTHYVTVNGIGEYTGTAKAEYTIEKQKQVVKGTATYTKYVDSGVFALDAQTDGDGKLVYGSNNTAVATVTSDGKVTVKGVGTAQISIYARETEFRAKSAIFKVTVKVAKKSQKVTGTASYTKRVGDATFKLNAATNGNGTLVYSSSNTTVAVVSSAGKVTPKGAGTAVISIYAQATEQYNKSNILKVTIKVAKKPQTVTVTASYNKVVGQPAFTVKAVTNGNGKLYYSTSNKAVAVVDKTGKVTIKGIGIAKIKVYAAETSTCSKSATKVITIKVGPRKMALSSVANTANNTITAKWAKQAGVSGYQIQYSAKSDFSKVKTVTAGASAVSKVISGLTKNATYYVRIRPFKTIGSEKVYSLWSTAKSAKISKGTAKVFAKTPVISIKAHDVEFKNTISWAKLDGATSYEVYVKKGTKGTWTKAATTKSLQYVHKVTHGVRYYYKVRAYQDLADGSRIYGKYSSEKNMLQSYEPEISVYMSSESRSRTSVFVLLVTNNGNGTMRVYSKGAHSSDHDYSSFDRNLYLADTTGDELSLEEASYIDIKPGDSEFITFISKEGDTWYDRKTTVYYDFKYDGMNYYGWSSSYYGSSYIKQ